VAGRVAGCGKLRNSPPRYNQQESPPPLTTLLSRLNPIRPQDIAEYPHIRRNFFMFMLDYVMFGIAFSLIGTSSSVVPSFMNQVTDSTQLIGLTGTLYYVCFLGPQLVLAQVVNRGTRRKPFMRPVLLFRLIILGLAMVIGMAAPSDRGLMSGAFLLAYALFAAGDSLIALPWSDMLGTSIPNHLRGQMFGIGQAGAALGAFAASAFSRWALGASGLAFPDNYALLFGVAGVLFFIGGFGLILTVEEKPKQTPEPGPLLREYLPYLGRILRTDKSFLRFTAMRISFDLSLMAAPFYTLVGVNAIGIPVASLVGDAIILVQVGSLSAAFTMAYLSRRSGSRAVLIVCGVLICIETSMGIMAALAGSQAALYIGFIATGLFRSMLMPTYFDWIITYAPPARRPIYFALSNTLSALTNFSPLLGGTLLAATTQSVLPKLEAFLLPTMPIITMTSNRYWLVFAGALCFGALALFLARRLEEPRILAAARLTAALPIKSRAGQAATETTIVPDLSR
jgi:MFS family permease